MTNAQKQTLSELKKKLCVTHTYCPCFEGFYNTLLESITDIDDGTLFDDDNAVNEDIMIFTYQTANDNEYTDYNKAFTDIAKNVVDYFNDYFKDDLRTQNYINEDLPQLIKFKFESLYTSKDYSRNNDSINIKATFTTDFIKFLNTYIIKNIDAFKEFLNDRFTSRSGFVSFYSNQAIDWISYANKKDLQENEMYLGTLLDFYFENEDKNIQENIYYYVFEQMRSNSCITEYLNYEKLINAVNEKFNLSITSLGELENLTL